MTVRRRALAGTAALALALSGLGAAALAAPAAAEEPADDLVFAGDPINDCPLPEGTLDAETVGAWWWWVCPQSTYIEEAETANKVDAIDGVGYLTALGAPEVPLLVPAGDAVVSSTATTFTTTWTDEAVDLGGGDVVDVTVSLELEGTYARWTIATVETGTSTPYPLTLLWEGNLGSDGGTVYDIMGNRMISSGDPNDPILLWEVDADSYLYSVVDLDDDVEIEAQDDEIVITLAMLDFGCPSVMNAPGAFTYAESLLGSFAANFGDSLQVPGTETCVTVAPVSLTPGQVFDLELALTLNGFDFSEGGEAYLDDYPKELPDWLDSEELDAGLDGVTPGVRIFGTAPTQPGTYVVAVSVYDNVEDDTYSRGFVTITVAPVLAATGVQPVWAAGAAALLALAAGALVLTARRRTA